MNGRAVRLHAMLLVAALAFAWLSFDRDAAVSTAGTDVGVLLADSEPGDTGRIVYEDAARRVVIEARNDSQGRWYYGTDTPTGGAEHQRIHIFRGGPNVESIWKAAEPLRAKRLIRTIGAGKRAEFGLDNTDGELEVHVRDKVHRFTLGAKAYGSADSYALDATGRIVLLPADLTRHLSGGAIRLQESRLLTTRRTAIHALTLQWRDREYVLIQHEKKSTRGAFWTRRGQTTGDPSLGALANKILALRTSHYQAASTPDTDWQLVLTVKVLNVDEERETLQIFAVPTKGDSKDTQAPEYQAISSHSRIAAELSRGHVEAILEALPTLDK